MAGLALTVGLGAALLFGMEPLVGRLVAPRFGGSAHVWLTCLTVFQALLFAAYLYAHGIAGRIGAGHLGIVALPLLGLPLEIGAPPAGALDPGTAALVAVLLRDVALPFFVLGTTAVVIQSWLARSARSANRDPYALYAMSNLGSLIALVAYPLVVEPTWGLTAQRWGWSLGYGLYALLVAGCYAWIRPHRPAANPTNPGPPAPLATPSPPPAPNVRDTAIWLVLSAVPSAFLLATTDVLASEIGSVPWVWIAPLALYLATFVWTFRDGGGIPPILGGIWPEWIGIAALAYLAGPSWVAAAFAQLAALTVLAAVAHGGLYEGRPAPAHLTRFYLTVSLGGWIGGALVTFGAPVVFDTHAEYPLILIASGGIGIALRGRRSLRWWQQASVGRGAARLAVWMGLAALIASGAWTLQDNGTLARHRSIHGTYRVAQGIDPATGDEVRRLFHGRTLHGAEVRTGSMAGRPVSYYHPSQCIAKAHALQEAQHRGVVGLGAGVAATFTPPGGTVHFYEIDADNEAIARQWFGHLDAAAGEVTVTVGDGRLALERSGATYDLLMIDAFSGDGIPVHLLTLEAMAIYADRLGPEGVLLYHVSNRTYALEAVIGRQIEAAGLFGVVPPADVAPLVPHAHHADCVVVGRSPGALAPFTRAGWIPVAASPDTALWTDDTIDLPAAMWQRWWAEDI